MALWKSSRSMPVATYARRRRAAGVAAHDEGGRRMSAQFQVDTDRIAAAAGDVARISAEIEGQVGVMLARLTGLQDAWTGTASAQFQGVVAQWRGTQQQVRASLDSIGQVLGAAGSQYAEAEASATRMFT
jgi:WXG100 family type VII secretion target